LKNVVQASVLSLFVAASMASAQTGPLANGYIYTYAGDGVPGYSGDGGPATSAGLFQPSDAALDAAGNIYIADTYNNRIRKVEAATGMIATIAGNGTQGYSGDGGPATSAEFCLPSGIVLDAAGNLYIADWCNNRIRKVDALTGIITTFAGGGVGGDGGPATNAGIEAPFSPALDSSGNLYFGDLGNDRVRKVDAATGIITTVAGDGIFGYSGDGGPATSAELYFPYGVALDPAGNLYIADTYNSRVRKVAAATGIITTIAGNGIQGYGGDGGPAINAELWSPWAVTLDTSGNLYFADANNNRVRLVNAATGIITTYAGDGTEGFSGDGGPAVDAALSEPAGLALDAKGSLYIADPDNSRIRVVRQGTLVATTTTLIAVPTTLTVGQTLTLTATVTAASGSGPAGSVLFYDGTVPLGTANLNSSGVATLTLTPAAGSYSITASYGGSSSDAPSQSAPPVSVTVNGIATTTTLTASATTLTFGQTLTLTATVAAASGGTPTGTVTFLNGTTSLGTAPLNGSGVGSLVLTPPVGVYSLTASYGGSSSDSASVSSPPITVTVISTATTTTLTPSLNPAPFGASVTFTAAVVTSAGIPAGTVSFYDGPSLLATSTLASGAATYSTSSLSVGLHNMTAVYAGAVGYSPSTSNTLAEVISAADFSISAAPGSQSVYTGEAASYAVAVTPGTGFDLPVALSCSQLPANTTCTFSPATVTGGSGSSALMVQTTAPSPPAAAFVFSTKIRVTALAGLLLLFIPRRLRRRIGRPMLLLIFALLAVGAAMAGCSAPGLLTGGTPVGAQTITLTGAATNGSQTLTHATTMTLNVKSLF